MRSDLVFWDVDTQYDFMKAGGKLYVPGSEEIIPVLGRLTDYAHRHGIRIIASADDHVAGHRELSDAPDWQETFPAHCMRGTPGQAKIRETTLRHPLVIEPEAHDPSTLAASVRTHEGDLLFHKHWFDVFTNPNVLPTLEALAPGRIVLYGVALDVCDRYAVEGFLTLSGWEVWLVEDAVKAIRPEVVPGLLEDWRRRGVTTIGTDGVLERTR